MKQDEFKKIITEELSTTLRTHSSHPLNPVLNYAVLPTGKMIRPLLVWAFAQDHNMTIDSNLIKLATSLEIHHSYTLVHDDLPAMDNDDERRGRPSHHKKYTPAKAILAGDALLALSLRLINDIDSKHHKALFNFYHWAIGSKGLILGQDLDLETFQRSFNEIIRIFELKTARLFQIALVGSYLISESKEINYKKLKNHLRIGSLLGILFQIHDDLDDFKNNKIEELNIFHNHSELAQNCLTQTKGNLIKHLDKDSEVLKLFKKIVKY